MKSDLPHIFVVAIVTTYQRSALLGRLLASLGNVCAPMAVLVVDNANNTETTAVIEAEKGRLEITRLVPGSNLGCGGGLEYGERIALERYPEATHFWILDDDAEIGPQALERMLSAMKKHEAQVACPTALDASGQINWIPGLLDPKAFQVIKTRCTLEKYLECCGPAPVRFSWAPGISLLVTRQALEKEGLHRADFWIRGEDIEFSLRLTYRGIGIFVPDAVVTHLPPTMATSNDLEMECKKEMCMLRNHAYIALHLPHGHRILRKLPGNIWRFIKNFGVAQTGKTVSAIWQGVLKRPAGVNPKIFPETV